MSNNSKNVYVCIRGNIVVYKDPYISIYIKVPPDQYRLYVIAYK